MEINIGGAIRRIIALEVGNMTSKAVSKFMIFISHLSIQNRLAALALLIFCVDFPADLMRLHVISMACLGGMVACILRL